MNFFGDFFQALIHVHLCLPWQQTKVEHYFSNSIDGETRFRFYKDNKEREKYKRKVQKLLRITVDLF